MASTIYNAFKSELMKGSFNLTSDTIKIALVSSSYSPNIDSHVFFSDVTNEVSASGSYSAGGGTLANKTVTQDNTDDEGVFDADDISFTSATITARGAVVYKSTGTASTSRLICYIDFGTDVVSTAGTFAIVFNSEGIVNIN